MRTPRLRPFRDLGGAARQKSVSGDLQMGHTENVEALARLCLDPLATDGGFLLQQGRVVELWREQLNQQASQASTMRGLTLKGKLDVPLVAIVSC